MLKELRSFENLGTLGFFWELLTKLNESSTIWTAKNAHEYFYNRVIDGRTLFDGCLPLLISINIIKINSEGHLIMDSSFKECLRTQRYFNDKILERLFTVLKEDPEFHKIFCSQNISFDVIYHTVQVENSAFKFKHSNFKQLLIDLDLLYPHPDKNIFKYIVNNKRKRFFDAVILPEIRAKRFGIEELQRQLAQRQIHGDQAENYVMEYEIARLENKKTPERVSLYSINAGYDIMSYDDALAENPNRFIEVKSFVGAPNFFWSSNEIDVARRKKDTYFLYLVDRDQMVHEDYRPLIIRNPIEVVLNDEERWSRRVDSYFIYQT